LLATRHGQIFPRAVAYNTHVRGTGAGWTFGFIFELPANAPELIRRYANEHYFSVQISKSGKDILVLHSSLPKIAFQPIRDK